MRTIGHYIGGRNVGGESGRFADVFHPSTGEVQAKVALASKAEMRAAVENAKAAQPAWAATNPQKRARVMMRFLELIRGENDALAELLASEHGKTVPDAKGDDTPRTPGTTPKTSEVEAVPDAGDEEKG